MGVINATAIGPALHPTNTTTATIVWGHDATLTPGVPYDRGPTWRGLCPDTTRVLGRFVKTRHWHAGSGHDTCGPRDGARVLVSH